MNDDIPSDSKAPTAVRGSGTDGDNYSGFNASAQPPNNGRQAVSVSGNVLVDSQNVQASLVQVHESGAAESVLVLALQLEPPSVGGGDNPVRVSFDGSVQLQSGNAISQVEVSSVQLGDLTIQVS